MKKKRILFTLFSLILLILVACGEKIVPTPEPTPGPEEPVVPEVTYTSISKLDTIEDGDKLNVKGVVYNVARPGKMGFYIADNTGSAFVYGSADDVTYGDEITIKGYKKMYFTLPQIAYDAKTDLKVISQSSFRPTYEETTIAALCQKDGTNSTNYSRNVTVEAKVVSKLEDFMTKWFIQDSVTGDEIEINYNSAENIVGIYKDKYVKISFTVYSYNDSSKRWQAFVSATETGIVEITNPTLTTDQKIEAVANRLTSQLNNKSFYNNITLDTTDNLYNSVITWVSSNPSVVANNGVVTLPDEPTEVVLTATIKIADKEKAIALSVIIEVAAKDTLKNILDTFQTGIINDKSFTMKNVAFDGIVTGARGTTGYFIQNGEYAVYIKGNKNNFVTGDCVYVVGTLKYNKQTIIDTPVYEKLIDADIPMPEAKVMTIAEIMAKDQYDVKMYATYISVTCILKGKPGQYGATYTLQDLNNDKKALTIHAASNMMGFSHYMDQVVTIKFHVQDYGPTFKPFTINADGELLLKGDDQTKVGLGASLLESIMPLNNETINTNIMLYTKHPSLSDISFVWTSSDNSLITNKGIYNNPTADGNVKLTCKIQCGNAEIIKEFNYKVEKNKENKANDLIISTLMRGATNDKLLTIFNNTGKTIDLSNYTIQSIQNTGMGSNFYSLNGANAQGILKLTGEIKDGETILFYHEKMSVEIVNQFAASLTKIKCPNEKGVVQFNGSDGDMVVLQRGSVIVDQIGSIESVPSQGQSTSWEKIFFASNTMIYRKSATTSNPALNWSDIDSVKEQFAVTQAIGASNGYTIPEYVYNFAVMIK